MEFKLSVTIMSGVEDGTELEFSPLRGDGEQTSLGWVLSIGRKDDNELCIRNDTYVSRNHARLILQDDEWMLEDLESTNGTFIENADDFFADNQVTGVIPIQERQLFRVGRTWLRFEKTV